MRSHKDVIREAGGVTALAKKLSLTDRLTTVQSWWHRDSIPGEYWHTIADLELATLGELAAAASLRRARRPKSTAA
jgi:hypothetical protein